MSHEPRHKTHQPGYTLLELMAVLAIISIAIAISAPKIGNGFHHMQLKTSVKRFASSLRAARSIAVSQRARVVAELDWESNTCTFSMHRVQKRVTQSSAAMVEQGGETSGQYVPEIIQEPFTLTDDIFFDSFLINDSSSENHARGVIAFFPHGNSTGGTVIISSNEGYQYAVSVDRLTGRVKVESLT